MAIEQTSINMSGKWVLATPLTMGKLKAELAAFAADTTMGLSRNEPKKKDFRCPVYYFNSVGTETANLMVSVQDCDAYTDSMPQFTTTAGLIAVMTGESSGGEATRDESEAVWTASFTCQLGDDTFQMIFHKDNLI
ncbi:MAG TPA: hypothetical protein O0X39_07045, partial [Methanocorpusculum sp.]|nr:hypothetical protein [Methanocorpusculum sp.]